jgi:hypothetical protein
MELQFPFSSFRIDPWTQFGTVNVVANVPVRLTFGRRINRALLAVFRIDQWKYYPASASFQSIDIFILSLYTDFLFLF